MKILVLALTLVVLACSSPSPNTTASNGGTGGTAMTSAGSGGAHSAGTGGASAGSPSGGAGAGGASAGGTSGASAGTGGSSGGASAGTGGGPTCNKCPANCCDAGSTCVDDGLGNLSCKKVCTTSSQCPTNAQCCELLKDGTGVCAVGDGTNLCRCTTGAECSTSACAPNTDALGNPVGPYICVAQGSAPYQGCNTAICGSGTCCFTDAKGNEFCASQCTNASMCGAAACVTYSNANTTCSGMLGCGPK